MFRKILMSLAMVAVIAGCSSGVKLNDVPVEDKGATSTSGMNPNASSGAAGQSGITGVDMTKNNNPSAGPAGVPTVVYFDYDSYVVKPEFQNVIEGHARFLRANPTRRVSIEGNTDERGGREYNLALGQKRSEAVRRALTLLGVPDAQLEAVSFGAEKPAATGNDEASFAKNRRAEFSYR